MSESAKIRERILPLLRDKTVLDIGCGREKIVPWAVGADDFREYDRTFPAADLLVDVSPETRQLEISLSRLPLFDVVFSSHTLEHMPSPIRKTLDYWLQFVRTSGYFIGYLPTERQYQFDPQNPKRRNPAHVHLLVPEVIRWHLEQMELDRRVEIEQFEVENAPFYSFLFVVRRIS